MTFSWIPLLWTPLVVLLETDCEVFHGLPVLGIVYQMPQVALRKVPMLVRSLRFGVGRGGSPQFVPISPFSSDLFRFALLVFGNTPICSDLLCFLPICSNLFSEQIRTNQGNPFLPTPFANPRCWGLCSLHAALLALNASHGPAPAQQSTQG